MPSLPTLPHIKEGGRLWGSACACGLALFRVDWGCPPSTEADFQVTALNDTYGIASCKDLRTVKGMLDGDRAKFCSYAITFDSMKYSCKDLDEASCTMDPTAPTGALAKVTQDMYRVYHCPEGSSFDNGDPWFLINCEGGMWKSGLYKPQCLVATVVVYTHVTSMVANTMAPANAMATTVVHLWGGMASNNAGTTTASPANAMGSHRTTTAATNTLGTSASETTAVAGGETMVGSMTYVTTNVTTNVTTTVTTNITTNVTTNITTNNTITTDTLTTTPSDRTMAMTTTRAITAPQATTRTPTNVNTSPTQAGTIASTGTTGGSSTALSGTTVSCYSNGTCIFGNGTVTEDTSTNSTMLMSGSGIACFSNGTCALGNEAVISEPTDNSEVLADGTNIACFSNGTCVLENGTVIQSAASHSSIMITSMSIGCHPNDTCVLVGATEAHSVYKSTF
ncbi:uncharacterized protein YBL113C-like [Penaeus chinensis]|uniref:uncharacterized protein YBL113C-like n=1 Tax=Penaeus chinensis TaxID=139456 RepID=UPI001FB7F8F3|nr:uncharacterized protein YBL113C-like [Penaeus chinensis]